MPRTIIATLLASVFLSLNVQAADLLQVYKDALSNDTAYSISRAALSVAREKIPQGRAGLLPSISASASSSRTNSNFAPDGSVNNNQTYKTESYGLTLTQPLFNWVNWEQYEVNKLIVAANEAMFAQTQQELMVRVSQAYFDVLVFQDILESSRAQKNAIAEQLEATKRNFDVGSQSAADMREVQARYDLVAAQEFSDANALEIRRSALQQIVGSIPEALAVLKSGIKLNPPTPATIETWITFAQNQNYGVRTSEISLEIAKRNIKKIRAGHLPVVNFFANANRANTNGSVVFNNSSRNNSQVIGVQLSMPIFSGGDDVSKVREAVAVAERARNELEASKRSATQIARNAYLGINFGLARVSALEVAETSSQTSLALTQLGYKAGVRVNIDVLNAQQQLHSARTELAKARYETIMNGLKLKSAAGNLAEEDLVEVNSLLVSADASSVLLHLEPQDQKNNMQNAKAIQTGRSGQGEKN